MTQRRGHRPFVTPAQAAYLARELFGIEACPDGKADCAGSAAAGAAAAGASGVSVAACCIELPSYDDRNFKLTGIMRGGHITKRTIGGGPEPWRPLTAACGAAERSLAQEAEEVDGLQTEDCGAAGGAQADARRMQFALATEDPGQHPWGVEVVVKVHNTQDSDQTAQLQALDEAMLRLQATGVCTNTPLSPRLDRSAAGDPSSPERCLHTNAQGGRQRVHTHAVARQDTSDDIVAEEAHVPYTLAVHPEERSDAAAAAATASIVKGAMCCWARLPCTCHPPRAARKAAASVPQAPVGPPAPVSDAGEEEGGQTGAGHKGAARQQERQHQQGEKVPGTDESAGRPELHWHVVRCLTYVPGRTLSSVEQLTPGLLKSLGRLVGRASAALAGWAPAALVNRRDHDWYPENGPAVLRRLVPRIAAFDPDKKSCLLSVAAELEAAAPLLTGGEAAGDVHAGRDPPTSATGLPRQVCHADANDDNCLVSDDGAEVVGLIDFGDMAVMPRVCEVSITVTYALLLAFSRATSPPHLAQAWGPANDEAPGSGGSTGFNDASCDEAPCGGPADMAGAEAGGVRGAGGTDATRSEEGDKTTLDRLLAVAGLVLSGFQQLVPLRLEELKLLPLLVRGRLAQSLALGAASVVADPGNAEYLLATQRPGWRVIRLLTPGAVLTEEQLLHKLLDATAQANAAA